MSKRGTGVTFCAIAAFLFATHYLAAALFAIAKELPEVLSESSRWLFLDVVSLPTHEFGALVIASVICLAIGIFYVIWSELGKEK